MELQTTEATQNSDVLSVISTETIETVEQSTPPVVGHPQATETVEQSKQSPPPVTNTLAADTSLPQVTNTQATRNMEHTTLPLEVTNTHETALSDAPTLSAVTNTQTTKFFDKSTLPALENSMTAEDMEMAAMASDVTNSQVNLIASPGKHRCREMRQESAEEEEEVRCILKIIAATGKFWYDWEKLRSMLSLHLMQVISEYPQAKMTMEEQIISLGETYAELAKRMDDALHSFVDGPPFTLQRLSEIILDARILYPNLSKLALALEKNLSVTSTLTISTDPYLPSLMTAPNGLNKVTDTSNSNPQLQSDTVLENGALLVAATADRDEIMTEVETDVGDVMTMDVEPTEKPSELSPMTTDIVGSSSVLVEPMGLSKL